MATEKQVNRLWALALNSARELGLGRQDASDRVNALLHKYGAVSPEDLGGSAYASVCDELIEWGGILGEN